MSRALDPGRSELRFGRFRLQPQQRQLLDDGGPVKLGGRAYDVLCALVERRGRPVPKGELMQAAWPRRVVEENNLQVQIVTLRKLLGATVITTVPGRGYQFTAAVEGASEPATPAAREFSAAPLPGNLPAELPALYGRADDCARLAADIGRYRLISLVGPGGIGKTRLAEAAVQTCRADFPDGVWLIELAPVAVAAHAVGAVARTLGLQLGAEPTADELAAAVRTRRMLLVLDNCEHLVSAAAAIAAALLRAAPAVHMLATSQEPLRLPDERVDRLGTLALPDQPTLGAARASGAVALFVARAQAAAPAFELNETSAPAVVEICRRLDGIALAIELAAARLPLLGLEGLRARLDDRLRVLTSGSRLAQARHQTLRAALEWSCALLSDAERAMFRRLGVFSGTFGLASAQRVGSGGTIDQWEALETLGVLVDKSLVVVEPDAVPRYRLLESGRAYALELLGAAGELDAARRQHAHAMLAAFRRSRDDYWTTTTNQRTERHAPDLDNLRAALDWAAAAGESELLIGLTGAASWLWRDLGIHAEGLRRCELALKAIDPTTPPRLEAMLHHGYLEVGRNRSLAAAPALASGERACALLRTLGDRQALYVALAEYARTRAAAGDAAGAEALLDEAAQLSEPSWPPGLRHPMLTARAFLLTESHRLSEARQAWEERLQLERALGDTRFATISLTNLVDAVFAEGDVEAAIVRGHELVALIRRERFANWESFALGNLSAALTAAGRLDEALATAREALPLLRQQGSVLSFLDHMGLLASRRGHHVAAARALGCAEELNRRAGYVRHFNELRARDQLRDELRARIAADELERLLGEGAQLGADDAAQQALAG